MLRPCASSLRALASTSKAVSVPISSMRRANFIAGTTSSSHAERTEVPAIGHPADPDLLDARHSRPLAKCIEKALQRRRVALSFHFHCAIVAVANVALKAQPDGMRLGTEQSPHPLDVPDTPRHH